MRYASDGCLPFASTQGYSCGARPDTSKGQLRKRHLGLWVIDQGCTKEWETFIYSQMESAASGLIAGNVFSPFQFTFRNWKILTFWGLSHSCIKFWHRHDFGGQCLWQFGMLEMFKRISGARELIGYITSVQLIALATVAVGVTQLCRHKDSKGSLFDDCMHRNSKRNSVLHALLKEMWSYTL